MPYRRVGKTVQVKKGGSWRKKGASKSVAGAKRYMRALYAHSKGK
jgi:hypothetical protein